MTYPQVRWNKINFSSDSDLLRKIEKRSVEAKLMFTSYLYTQ